MANEQPPAFILSRVVGRNRARYGTGAVAAGVVVVIAALLVLAWLLSH